MNEITMATNPSTPPLSPATRAVLEAAWAAYLHELEEIHLTGDEGVRLIAAAVIRAIADQVVPQYDQPSYADDFTHGAWFARDDVYDDLLRIAKELEAQ